MCATFSTSENIEFKPKTTHFPTQLQVGSIPPLFNHPHRRLTFYLHLPRVVENVFAEGNK
jgi:hypothetical protein